MTKPRGSIIVESAFTLTVLLTLLYGALQLGVVGLEQLTVDGGAFTAAHQQSFAGGVNSYLSGTALAKQALTHLNSPNVNSVATIGEPPTTLFSGQYGFNQPNARYGGVSLVQPVQTIATITRNRIQSIVLGVTGSSTTVTGIAIEPAFRLINGHANVGGNSFNSVSAFKTNADPLSESAPPYFVGFNYLQMCSYFIPGNAALNWTNCPNPALVTALGSAEYLDAHNWGRTVNGVKPSQQAVFWEARYHQGLFALISSQLQANPNPTIKAKILDPLGLDPQGRADNVACVYSFDNNYVGAYPPGNIGIGDPLFALHPEGVNPKCPAR